MKRLLQALVALLACGPVWALDPKIALQNLNHRAYTAVDGALGQEKDIRQTADGTLWVATDSGLLRFDGGRFVRFNPPNASLPSNSIESLAVTPDGALWIGYQFGGVSKLKSGKIVTYGENDGLPSGTVAFLQPDINGTIYAFASTTARLRGNRWEPAHIDNNVYAGAVLALVDQTGTFWVNQPGGIAAVDPASGAPHFLSPGLRALDKTNSAFVRGPDGALWIAQEDGIVRIDIGHPDRRQKFAVATPGPLLFDRDRNLWIGGQGLRRASWQALTAFSSGARAMPAIETLTPANGLSGRRVSDLLEDREGDVWVLTNGGIDRFSNSNVVRFAPKDAEAAEPVLPPFHEVPLPDADGNLWLYRGRITEDSGELIEVRNNHVISSQKTARFTCAYRNDENNLWFAGPEGIAKIVMGRPVLVPLPEQAANSEVQAIVRDTAGALWVSVVRRGVFRLYQGKWTQPGSSQVLPGVPAVVETTNHQGVLWFGYTGNRVASLEAGRMRLFTAADGLRVGNITAISARGAEVWVGGEQGIARLDRDHFVSVRSVEAHTFDGISGIVETESGDLWMNGNAGVSHLPRAELERALRDPNYRVQSQTFDSLDGMPGVAVQLRPLPSVLQGKGGQLWFVSANGLATIDPEHLHRNNLPPPVTIWSLVTHGTGYAPADGELRLPRHASSVEIFYSAGSLVVPERVQYRYRLLGADDRSWQSVANRREAVYTNLRPGHYHFQVIASNDDGVWNKSGASLDFFIAPTFMQTSWFYLMCGLACVGVLSLCYRIRVHQLLRQTRARLQERVSERERVARELHDTLLQGMQGVLLQFQAVANRIPSPGLIRERMEQALERAEQVLVESRRHVQSLRSNDLLELPEALAKLAQQVSLNGAAILAVSVEGTRRAVHPIVSEEVFGIAREAISNACRHSGASKIEVEVVYSDVALAVRVRDDGRGIEPDLVRSGKPGHWGLIGMRERAKKIRAHLEIRSHPGAGTEVNLRVPAAVAYRRDAKRHRRQRAAIEQLDLEDTPP